MEAKFIAFAQLLIAAGFEVHAVSNLPTSLKTDFIEDIIKSGIIFYDTSKLNFEESEEMITKLVNQETFNFIFDDGGHTYTKMVKKNLSCICTEYTQSGVKLALKSNLKVPVVNLNSSITKSLIGNVHGTGISALTAIQAITNISFYKLNIGIIGLGPIGLSCSFSFKGAGANVSAYDIDASKKNDADKHQIHFLTKEDLLSKNDMIITCTGSQNAITTEELSLLQDQCILANVGHYNNEIQVPDDTYYSKVTPHISEHHFEGKTFYLLCDGNLVNLAFGMGYPIQVIDISFAASIYAWDHFSRKEDLEGRLYEYPLELDQLHFKKEIEFYSLE